MTHNHRQDLTGKSASADPWPIASCNASWLDNNLENPSCRKSISSTPHMPQSKFVNSRKRQRLQLPTPEQSLQTSPQSKRQRVDSSSTGSQSESSFWDSLSKVWLTRRALKELDRRNAKCQRLREEPIQARTRKQKREQRNKNTRSCLSAVERLHKSSPNSKKEIRRFARGGGPDLSDIVGVCCSAK